MATDSLIGRRWEVMREALDERQRRLLVATEAKVLGRGGVSAVAAATGVSRSTIMAGLNEIELMHAPDRAADEPTGSATRMRRAGGGRKRIEAKDETLVADLLALVDPLTRGDPQSPLRWTCKSLRTLADQLKASGHSVSHVVVGQLLKAQGSSGAVTMQRTHRHLMSGAAGPARSSRHNYA